MKEIPLTQGLVAIVDDEDYESLSAYKWCAAFAANTNSFYAIRNGRGSSKRGRGTIRMHRIILDAPAGIQVDHANGNTLDNRRNNIRLATRNDNNRNRKLSKTNTSGYKGVCRDSTNTWKAQITVNDTNIYLGSFPSRESAYEAYCQAARNYHGEFARLQ